MIVAHREIAVHLKLIRNLTGLTSGRFNFRISVQDTNNYRKILATPFNLIEKDTLKQENRSEIEDHYYTSRNFFLKSGMNVQLNEICVFKLHSPLIYDREEQSKVHLICELVYVDQQKSRIVSMCKLKMGGNAFHEYLQINFYQSAPIQLVGTIHSCIYKFQFLNQEGNAIDLRTYMERFSKYRLDEVAEYLSSEGNHSFQVVSTLYSQLTGKTAQVTCIFPDQKEEEVKQFPQPPVDKVISEKAFPLEKIVAKAKSRKRLFTNETQKTQGDEDHVQTDPTIGEKKRRKKIFNTTSKELKLEKIHLNEKLLHQNAQKIYQIWRQVISMIFEEQGNKFFSVKCLEYQKKIKQKVGESIIRFKGSRFVDMYGDEEQMRIKLAYQLRNQDKEFFSDQKNMLSNGFPVIDQGFFTAERPIFFQEFAEAEEKAKESKPIKEILVIMVHGLGACRLDMEKIKVQLRRYYDYKVKLYISSSNEARTEGDIDEMGARLANQVDYELTKYPQIPKICFLGHSMGGIIIRSALPRLEKYKDYFHSLITLSSPHLGYTYSTSALIDAGLWLINQMKKCTSIEQLTMQDNEDQRQTFLYKLSKKPGLEWFKRLVFLASHQDLYVPYYSARVQKSQQSLLDQRKQVFKGQLYCKMIDNMLSNYKGEIIRLNVNFCIPEQNIDNLIGRAAHISFINSVEMVRTFVIAGPHYFF